MLEYLLSLSLLPMALTIGAFMLGAWVQKKTKCVAFNPIIVAVILIVGFLLLTKLGPDETVAPAGETEKVCAVGLFHNLYFTNTRLVCFGKFFLFFILFLPALSFSSF